jgi:hypothetical protein
MTMMRATRTRTALFFVVVAAVAAPAAVAGWAVTGGGGAATKSLVMPQGATPTASASGGDVSVSWSAVTVGSAPVSYTVRRLNASSGLPATVGSSCSGTLSATSCTETAVPSGTWRYAVTPVLAAWTGVESALSATVTIGSIAAPTSVALANGGGVGNAYVNLANRASVQVAVGLGSSSVSTDTVSVTITDSAGTSVTRTAAATNGASTVTVTGFNTTTLLDGALTISARVTSQSGVVSAPRTATATKDTVAPGGADIRAVNRTGGLLGRAEQGDVVTYTFSEPMNPASFVAGWTGASTNTVFRLSNSNPDSVTILSTALAQLPFGLVGLASSAWVSAAVDFTSSPAVMAASTITITLGPTSAPNNRFGTLATATTMTWTPAGTPTDLAGNPLSTTAVTEQGPADVDF